MPLSNTSRVRKRNRIRSYQEEYRDFLRKYGVEFDDCYIWD